MIEYVPDLYLLFKYFSVLSEWIAMFASLGKCKDAYISYIFV